MQLPCLPPTQARPGRQLSLVRIAPPLTPGQPVPVEHTRGLAGRRVGQVWATAQTLREESLHSRLVGNAQFSTRYNVYIYWDADYGCYYFFDQGCGCYDVMDDGDDGGGDGDN